MSPRTDLELQGSTPGRRSPELVALEERGRARTAADVRLEVAAARAKDPAALAIELKLARNRLENARSRVALDALGFARMVDRAAAALSEAWVFETLGLTEAEIVALVRAPTQNLADLAPKP